MPDVHDLMQSPELREIGRDGLVVVFAGFQSPSPFGLPFQQLAWEQLVLSEFVDASALLWLSCRPECELLTDTGLSFVDQRQAFCEEFVMRICLVHCRFDGVEAGVAVRKFEDVNCAIGSKVVHAWK